MAAFSKATSDTEQQSSSYVIESQEQEYSYFLGGINYLESVVEAYFNLRPVEDEPDDNCDDFSSNKEGDQDDNIDSDNDLEFDFSEVDKIPACKSGGIHR